MPEIVGSPPPLAPSSTIVAKTKTESLRRHEKARKHTVYRGPKTNGSDLLKLLIKGTDYHLEMVSLWERFLQAVESDQFTEDSGSFAYGGWSKSYRDLWIQTVFPDRTAAKVSLEDSISITQMFIRGLLSLRRMLPARTETAHLIVRIEDLLRLARTYLDRHYDGVGAGLVHMTAVGPKIALDARHSATFAKAMEMLGNADRIAIQNAVLYCLTHAEEQDSRLHTWAEALGWIGRIISQPSIFAEVKSSVDVLRLRDSLEERILSFARDIWSTEGPCKLISNPNEWHVAPHQTWWALDVCGSVLPKSQKKKIQVLTNNFVCGLSSLLKNQADGSAGYPLTLDGPPDLGGTAAIGEVLWRLDRERFSCVKESVVKFIAQSLTEDKLGEYRHLHMVWAVPCFLELYQTDRGKLGTPFPFTVLK